MTLKIARQLELPVDAVTQTFAWLGRRGSGKTYGATKMAETMLDIGAQIVALDPVGLWYGLRLNERKTGPSPYTIPVLGGLHGDIPLEPTAGALIADLVVDRGISVVLDVSRFEADTDKARFAAAFAARFYHRKKASPSAVHVFLEECQEFIPQNPARGEEHMLAAFNRMMKLGRNFGIGMSLISQRPQEVNKKSLNMSEVLFAFQMTGKHERKAIEEWAVESGVDEDRKALSDRLPFLEVGAPHVWSPQWLRIAQVVHILKKHTADVSSTPKVGEAPVEAKPLGAIDLAQLRDTMAATIAKAEAEDPSKLQKKLAVAERELAQLRTQKPVADPDAIVKAVERARAQWTRELRAAVEKDLALVSRIADAQNRHASDGSMLAKDLVTAVLALDGTLRPGDSIEITPPASAPVPLVSAEQERHIRRAAFTYLERETVSAKRDVTPRASVDGVTKSHQKILDALALMESIGSPGKRVNVGFFAGYTEGGRYNNLLGELKAMGLIEYPAPAMLALTDAGRAIADAQRNEVRTLDDLHALWLSKLPQSEAKVLQAVLNYTKSEITKGQLGELTDYSEGGRFNNILGRLRSLGAIDYVRPGVIAATDALFPEGLV